MTTLVLDLGPDADDLQKKVRELAAELVVKNQQLLDASCEVDRLRNEVTRVKATWSQLEARVSEARKHLAVAICHCSPVDGLTCSVCRAEAALNRS